MEVLPQGLRCAAVLQLFGTICGDGNQGYVGFRGLNDGGVVVGAGGSGCTGEKHRVPGNPSQAQCEESGGPFVDHRVKGDGPSAGVEVVQGQNQGRIACAWGKNRITDTGFHCGFRDEYRLLTVELGGVGHRFNPVARPRRTVWSFTRLSSHSSLGFELETSPHPAKAEAESGAINTERMATTNSPSS